MFSYALFFKVTCYKFSENVLRPTILLAKIFKNTDFIENKKERETKLKSARNIFISLTETKQKGTHPL